LPAIYPARGFNMNKTRRLIILDVIRVTAFFLVFFTHVAQRYQLRYGQPFGILNFYWVTLGGVGVTLFILLSGTVLGLKYKNNKLRLVEFLQNRVLRIYIPYILSILFVILFVGKSVLFNSSFGKNILDFSGFLVFTGTSWANYILPTGWFVGLILSLYLLFPLINELFERYPINYVLLILLAVEVASRLLIGRYGSGYRPLDWFPLCRVFEFGLGIWLAKNDYLVDKLSKITLPFGEKLIIFLSSISYSAYLIHYYYLHSLPVIDNKYLFAIRVLVLTAVTASAINFLDNKIKGKIFNMRIIRGGVYAKN
jgi:peptidoglycan/LPS O-acetylase OafA/YrhL